MKTRFFLKSVALLGATAGCFLLSQSFALAQTQTNEAEGMLEELQGSANNEPTRTLQELQGSANNAPANSLQTLQERAAALEAERSTRTPTVTPESAPLSGDTNVVAQISTATGKTTVMLMNNTGAAVTYEVIGQTAPRTLAAGESTQLDALPIPVTVTAQRQDAGLLDMAATVSEGGPLTVTLSQSEFDEVQGALRIREDGFVFIN